jgi:signal transduction histidine kinase/CheY-like chemotaxis protein
MSKIVSQHLADDAALGLRILREHVASVYAGHSTAVLAHFGFAAALAVFSYSRLNHPWLLYWLLVLAAVDLYALLTPRWTPGTPISDSPYWARKYARLVTMVSVATAPAPLLFVSTTDLVMTTVFTVVIIGSWTRAVQARWPLKPAMFGYGIPMMTGLIAALLWHGSALNWFLAAFGIANLVLTLRAGLQENRRLTESLILRFENEALAARLSEQIAATERASAEKTRFLATASHDLRQPMHAIALFGAALENALHNRPEGENAERLMRAVDTLGASLNTMLDVSRLDAGVVVPEPCDLELDALFRPLNHTFSAQADQKNLQLRIRASGLWVRSDPQLLYRMLSNLVDNALKYTRHGGVTVTALPRGNLVWIEVRDTGIGVPPGQLDRIFEEFYQIGNPGRDRSRGLGIGLSIVQRLSQLLDHPVQVRSRPGRGTRFRLRVPTAEASPDSPTDLLLRDLESPVRHRFAVPDLRGRILLIDDESEIRQAMTVLLHAYSLDIVAVADEAAAVEVLTHPDAQAKPFALLLCDYRLAEGVDGLDVGLRLRECFQPDASLLLITGETAPERLQHVRASGVPVLFKPVSAATLLQTMAELASADSQRLHERNR